MKRKKIGIVTLCGNFNYGNKLQNYAIVKTLEKLGLEAETIWVKNTGRASLKDVIYFSTKAPLIDHLNDRKRKKYFFEFNKLLNIHNSILFKDDMKKVAKKYFALIVGSDQVWNPDYFTNSSIYLLNDVDARKIAFSASFGVNNIPANRLKEYESGLKAFNAISVREERGKELVAEITKKDSAVVLVDPTMLLTDDEWSSIAKKPEFTPKRYILKYFLGKPTPEREAELKRIAQEKQCEIVDVISEDSSFHNIGPREFIYLEKHAELICTDSFHSCVFAILFKRPFIVYDRIEPGVKKMNSRIETLIKKFGLKDRNYNEKKITPENLTCDYSNSDTVLKTERDKSITFLTKNLEV